MSPLTKHDEVVMRLRAGLQDALDNSWHYYECPSTRRTEAECRCGVADLRRRIEALLKDTLDA